MSKQNHIIIKGKDYQIGQKICFSKKYSTNAHDRFRKGNIAEPMGYLQTGVIMSGWVVGVRSVIMKTTRYNPVDYEGFGDRHGDKETLLLVTSDARKRPFLVRPIDLVEEVPA